MPGDSFAGSVAASDLQPAGALEPDRQRVYFRLFVYIGADVWVNVPPRGY